jgi:ferrous iron transport protein A
MPVKPLNELKNGEKGRIVKIGGGGGLRQRFLEWHGERGRMANIGGGRGLRQRFLDWHGERGRMARMGGGGGFHQRFPEKHGERSRMARMGGRGSLRRRLLDMGLVPGSEVEMERAAPLGDPIEIKVKGCYLALRKEEAASIQVEVT